MHEEAIIGYSQKTIISSIGTYCVTMSFYDKQMQV